MTDIFAIKPTEQISVELLHPADKSEIGLRIFLRSHMSDEVKKVQRSIQNKRIKLEQRRKSFTAEDETINTIDLTVACMVNWEWYVPEGGEPGSFNGEQPKFNEVNARKLASIDWVREQIDFELGETGRFFTN